MIKLKGILNLSPFTLRVETNFWTFLVFKTLAFLNLFCQSLGVVEDKYIEDYRNEKVV